jgi:glutaredoxin
MADAPLPDLILYGRPGCGLCDEARDLLRALIDERGRAGRPTPTLTEIDIESDPDLERRLFTTIPVVELGDRRLELATSAAKLRRLLSDVLDAEPATTA